MIEVYAFPMRKEAPRIWKSLDYIFDVPPHLPPKAKAELILTDLRDRMEQYAQARKVRASVEQEQRIESMGEKFSLSAVIRLRNEGEVGEKAVVEGQGEGAQLVDILANHVPAGEHTEPLPPINFNNPLQPPIDGNGGCADGGGDTIGSSGQSTEVTPLSDTQMGGLMEMEDIDWVSAAPFSTPFLSIINFAI